MRNDAVAGSPVDVDLQPSDLAADARIARLREDVAHVVRRVCPRWLADEADDLTQIAVVRVIARVRATAGEISYTPGYLYRAAHSALVDEIRRRRRLREVPIDVDVDVKADAGANDPDRRVAAADIRNAIGQCLKRLIPSRRQAVTLHLQGHSVIEASALLDCDRKKARNLIYRGLADLRTCLIARGVEP